MATRKRFEYSIDIEKPCQFMIDKERNVLLHLKENLEHTCLQGVLIVSIADIETMTIPRIVHSNSRAIFIMNIIFQANIIFYTENDIIDLVKIVVDNCHVYGKHEYATITFTKNDIMKSLKKEQIIPIRLGKMQRYTTCNTTFISNGSLLTCETSFDYYHIRGTLSEEEIGILNEKLNYINSAKKEINYSKSTLNKNIVETISKDPTAITTEIILYLLYAYHSYNIPKDVISFESLLARTEFDTVIYKDIKIPNEMPVIQEVSAKENAPTVTPFKGIYSLMMKTYTILHNIDSIVKFYQSTGVGEYDNLFNIWLANKDKN